MASQRAMERRMALLFVVSLLLVGWQAWRIRPLAPPDFVSVYEPGGLVMPLAVPSWRPLPAIPDDREARRELFRTHAIGGTESPDPALCQLFLRVSSDHWYELQMPPAALRSLTLNRPGRPGPGGTETWPFAPEGLLDDDDGDGELVDPGELASAGPGAEAEAFCPMPMAAGAPSGAGS